MSIPSHRRGEAHLWLLFEEVLAEARQVRRSDGDGGADPVWGPRQRFGYAAHALASAGVVPAEVGIAIIREMNDALAVRSLLPAESFAGEPFPADAAVDAPAPTTDAANWLEAEIERHLDLVSAFDPVSRPTAGDEAVGILGIPERALVASGALPAQAGLVDALAASLAAAGFPVTSRGAGAAARPEWVGFLRDRPRPLTDSDRPEHVREVIKPLGPLAGLDVSTRSIGWSDSVIELEVGTRLLPGTEPRAIRPFLCSAVDDRGTLHLGQIATSPAESVLRFRLRPGIEDGVRELTLRLTVGATRAETTIAL